MADKVDKMSGQGVYNNKGAICPCAPPRYRNGTRGRTKAALVDLLSDYYQVEENFKGEATPTSCVTKVNRTLLVL